MAMTILGEEFPMECFQFQEPHSVEDLSGGDPNTFDDPKYLPSK